MTGVWSEGDRVHAAVPGGPGFDGVILLVDDETAIVECAQCGSHEAHETPLASLSPRLASHTG